MPCQAMEARRAARGDRKSGANGCQGASWSEERNGKKLRGALGGGLDLKPRGYLFSVHRLLIILHLLQCGILILKCSPCTAEMQYRSTSDDSDISLVNCAICVLSNSK